MFQNFSTQLSKTYISIPNAEFKELKQARLSSTQNSFEITPPRNFTIQLLYNKNNTTISCNDVEVEERKWMNPCNIETYDDGSVYQHIIARILDALILGLKFFITYHRILLLSTMHIGRVSVQGVKSLGGHFACLCRGFEFYEVKNKFFLLLFFKKKMEILLHF